MPSTLNAVRLEKLHLQQKALLANKYPRRCLKVFSVVASIAYTGGMLLMWFYALNPSFLFGSDLESGVIISKALTVTSLLKLFFIFVFLFWLPTYIGNMIFGALLDVVGRQKVARLVGYTFGASLLLTAFFPSIYYLTLFIASLSGAAFYGVAGAFLRDVYSPLDSGRYLGQSVEGASSLGLIILLVFTYFGCGRLALGFFGIISILVSTLIIIKGTPESLVDQFKINFNFKLIMNTRKAVIKSPRGFLLMVNGVAESLVFIGIAILLLKNSSNSGFYFSFLFPLVTFIAGVAGAILAKKKTKISNFVRFRKDLQTLSIVLAALLLLLTVFNNFTSFTYISSAAIYPAIFFTICYGSVSFYSLFLEQHYKDSGRVYTLLNAGRVAVVSLIIAFFSGLLGINLAYGVLIAFLVYAYSLRVYNLYYLKSLDKESTPLVNNLDLEIKSRTLEERNEHIQKVKEAAARKQKASSCNSEEATLSSEKVEVAKEDSAIATSAKEEPKNL